MKRTLMVDDTVRRTVSAREAALMLGVGKNVIFNMIRDGQIYAVRLGPRRVVIPVAVIENLLTDPGQARSNGSGQTDPRARFEQAEQEATRRRSVPATSAD